MEKFSVFKIGPQKLNCRHT